MVEMSDTEVAKGISIVIIFAGSLMFGLIPAFRGLSTVPRFDLSLILSCGGGILIATSLVHILPEARQGWDIPGFTAEMSLGLGIFLVYFVEELVHHYVCHDMHSPQGHHESAGHNHGVHVHHEEKPNPCQDPLARYVLGNEMSRLNKNGNGHHENGGNEEAQNEPLASSPQQPEPGNGSAINEEKATTWRALAGLVALSTHAFLEGLTIGLGKTASDVWYLCIAVGIYKLVIAFCLGMEVRNASSSKCTEVRTSSSRGFQIRYVFYFAIMTPLGIFAGMVITGLANHPSQTESSLFVPVLQTIAGGALLYVAFFEVICRERARYSGKGLKQLAAVVVGFVIMAFAEVFVIGHDHSYPPCEYFDQLRHIVTGNSNPTVGSLEPS